jgi:hypothetical protein
MSFMIPEFYLDTPAASRSRGKRKTAARILSKLLREAQGILAAGAARGAFPLNGTALWRLVMLDGVYRI